MKDTGNLANLYDNYHAWKGWKNLFAFTSDDAGYFTREMHDVKISGADVLEIGFGSGACLSWMAHNGARIVGCEIDPQSVAAATSRGIELLPADLLSAAPDFGGRFDTIIALDVFEHIPLEKLTPYLTTCVNLLRNGGRLIMRFPNAQSPFGLFAQHGDPTHCSALSRQSIELLAADLPLKTVRYSGSFWYFGKPMTPRWGKRHLRKVVQKVIGWLLRFIYATHIPYDPIVVLVLERE